MNAKLTLRMDTALIESAKREAAGREKSVSQMVGVLKDGKVTEEAYKHHLREKYL